MILNTIKRNVKAKSLTHEEFDGNWDKIETVINAQTKRERYQMTDINTTYYEEGENTACEVRITLKVLEDLIKIPLLKVLVTVNGKVRKFKNKTNVFRGAQFPIPSNTILTNDVDISWMISEDDWPMEVKIFIEDDEGHYYNTYTFMQTANPL